MRESDLTQPCLAALRALGCEVWRCQSGVVKVRGAWMHLAPKGTADMIGYMPGGRFLAAETKASHKDACACDSCEAQRVWGARLTAAGGLYVPRVRSVEQLVDAVRAAL